MVAYFGYDRNQDSLVIEGSMVRQVNVRGVFLAALRAWSIAFAHRSVIVPTSVKSG